jgi:hypothetical protein
MRVRMIATRSRSPQYLFNGSKRYRTGYLQRPYECLTPVRRKTCGCEVIRNFKKKKRTLVMDIVVSPDILFYITTSFHEYLEVGHEAT